MLDKARSFLFRRGASDDARDLGPVAGTVEVWHNELGWGIATAPDVAGDVWIHFSAIEEDGYRSMRRGDRVRFTYSETPGSPNDLYGCPYMAESATRLP